MKSLIKNSIILSVTLLLLSACNRSAEIEEVPSSTQNQEIQAEVISSPSAEQNTISTDVSTAIEIKQDHMNLLEEASSAESAPVPNI